MGCFRSEGEWTGLRQRSNVTDLPSATKNMISLLARLMGCARRRKRLPRNLTISLSRPKAPNRPVHAPGRCRKQWSRLRLSTRILRSALPRRRRRCGIC